MGTQLRRSPWDHRRTTSSPADAQPTEWPGGSSLLEKFELESGALTLPGGHASGDELDKMESSLVAGELPLLIEDLLEHEKKSCRRSSSFQAQLQPVQQQQPQQHSLLSTPGPAQAVFAP